jgi:putative ABC transport system permease protein
VITVLGSSIALMNIMIVSVTERTREIGVRKALGLKNNDCYSVFFRDLIDWTNGRTRRYYFGILIGLESCHGFAFVIPWSAIMAAFITSL